MTRIVTTKLYKYFAFVSKAKMENTSDFWSFKIIMWRLYRKL